MQVLYTPVDRRTGAKGPPITQRQGRMPPERRGTPRPGGGRGLRGLCIEPGHRRSLCGDPVPLPGIGHGRQGGADRRADQRAGSPAERAVRHTGASSLGRGGSVRQADRRRLLKSRDGHPDSGPEDVFPAKGKKAVAHDSALWSVRRYRKGLRGCPKVGGPGTADQRLAFHTR